MGWKRNRRRFKGIEKIRKFGGNFCWTHRGTGLTTYIMQLTLFPLDQYRIVQEPKPHSFNFPKRSKKEAKIERKIKKRTKLINREWEEEFYTREKWEKMLKPTFNSGYRKKKKMKMVKI